MIDNVVQRCSAIVVSIRVSDPLYASFDILQQCDVLRIERPYNVLRLGPVVSPNVRHLAFDGQRADKMSLEIENWCDVEPLLVRS